MVSNTDNISVSVSVILSLYHCHKKQLDIKLSSSWAYMQWTNIYLVSMTLCILHINNLNQPIKQSLWALVGVAIAVWGVVSWPASLLLIVEMCPWRVHHNSSSFILQHPEYVFWRIHAHCPADLAVPDESRGHPNASYAGVLSLRSSIKRACVEEIESWTAIRHAMRTTDRCKSQLLWWLDIMKAAQESDWIAPLPITGSVERCGVSLPIPNFSHMVEKTLDSKFLSWSLSMDSGTASLQNLPLIKAFTTAPPSWSDSAKASSYFVK